jgi:hypothetical protein
MNRLIPGALFNPRAAKEQRLVQTQQDARTGVYSSPDDLRDDSYDWAKAAEGFRKYDPDLSKLAKLLKK